MKQTLKAPAVHLHRLDRGKDNKLNKDNKYFPIMKATDLTIFVTSVKGEEIQIEKACTLKQAVTLAKKEARKMINNGGLWVAINIQARASYGVESLAHIEAEKEGRRVVFSDETPAETYAVCWGDEYKEEDGESNVIAETADESAAREIAESESAANSCTMSVVRKSDGKVMAIYNNQPEPTNPDNTPSTMNANETTTPEFSELSHAAQCLDIYLHNTAEIYDRYTVPAIKKVAAMMRSNATHPQQFDVSSAGVSGLWEVIRAISAAVGLVRKYDKLAPTQDDKKHVIRNYAAYIVDCAKYEIENA